MADIVVVHHGLGLWVNRGEYWEILFPDAEQMTTPGGKSQLEAHEPALCVPSAFIGGHAVFTVIPLRNHMVDFRGLAEGNLSASLEKDFMIGLQGTTTAPAIDPNAFNTHSDKVVGSVILPPGTMQPTVNPVGPVEFGGNTNRFLAFAVTWSAPFIGKELSVDIVERTTGKIQKVPLQANPVTGNIELRVRNLSAADLNPVPGARSRIDVDFAAHYVLVPQPDGTHEVPQFEHAQFPAPGAIIQSMGDLTGADETHLCSGAFMVPPPPEI